MKNLHITLLVLSFCFVGCMRQEEKDLNKPQQSPVLATTGSGDVVIYDPDTKMAHFLTKSGVLFKSVSILNPDKFETWKYVSQKIHNTSDSLFLSAEWIGDKVFWNVSTNKLNTRSASYIGMATDLGTEVIRLCTNCDWAPVYGNTAGKTTNYQVSGTANNISIDQWNAASVLTYRANPD